MTDEEMLLANGPATITALQQEIDKWRTAFDRLLTLTGDRITLNDLYEAGFTIGLEPL